MTWLQPQADLVYNIVDETLVGSIDGVKISAKAGSGGRAGTKEPGAVVPLLANNPFATGVKLSSSTPGGPIPRARYQLVTHESRPMWIRLTPVAEDRSLMRNRDGFAIHGRGVRGSDGCIVPYDFAVLQLLHRLVRAREMARRPAPTLAVISVGDFGRFERLHVTA